MDVADLTLDELRLALAPGIAASIRDGNAKRIFNL